MRAPRPRARAARPPIRSVGPVAEGPEPNATPAPPAEAASATVAPAALASTGELRIEYLALHDIARFDRNPKRHDIPSLVASINRYGFRDAPIFDATLQALVAGHGRLQALETIEAKGDPAPAGIRVVGGVWHVPVQLGVDAASGEEAVAFLLDHNLLALSALELPTSQALEIYDPGQLQALLEGMTDTVAIGAQDVEAVVGQFTVQPGGLPALNGADRQPYRQATFILHDDQEKLLQEALAIAKAAGGGESPLNANKNGNALMHVVAGYLAAVRSDG